MEHVTLQLDHPVCGSTQTHPSGDAWLLRALAEETGTLLVRTSMIASSPVPSCIHRLKVVGLARLLQMMLLGSGAASTCILRRLREGTERATQHRALVRIISLSTDRYARSLIEGVEPFLSLLHLARTEETERQKSREGISLQQSAGLGRGIRACRGRGLGSEPRFGIVLLRLLRVLRHPAHLEGISKIIDRIFNQWAGF